MDMPALTLRHIELKRRRQRSQNAPIDTDPIECELREAEASPGDSAKVLYFCSIEFLPTISPQRGMRGMRKASAGHYMTEGRPHNSPPNLQRREHAAASQV